MRHVAATGKKSRSRSIAMIESMEGRRMLSATPAAVVAHTVPVGVTITAEAGESFSGVVGKVDGLSPGLLANYKSLQATITWGDSATISPDAGTLSVVNKELIVSGTHTFAKPGVDKVNVIVETRPPIVTPPTALIEPLLLADIHSTARVTSDENHGVTLTEVATQKFTATLGYFEFKNVDLALSATITWGDGSTSQGTVQRTGPDFDDWKVIGTHTYGKTGVYNVTIGVTARPIGAPGPTPQFILDLTTLHSQIDVKGRA